MQDVPFWEAVERLRRQAGLRVRDPVFDENCQPHTRDLRSSLVSIDGAFRVEATGFFEGRGINFENPGKDGNPGQREHRLLLNLALVAEPRFMLVRIGTPQVESAQDEDGKSLATSSLEELLDEKKLLEQFARGEMLDGAICNLVGRSADQEYHCVTAILLQRGSDKARTLKVLRGVIPVEVVVERKRVIVTEKFLESTGTECRVGQDAIKIIAAEDRKEKGYSVRFTVPPFPRDARTCWVERTHLEDARGNRYQRRLHGDLDGGEMVTRININYEPSNDPQLGPPKRLIIEDWRFVRHLLRFEFKDVPLP
jgi:hypothetical protein